MLDRLEEHLYRGQTASRTLSARVGMRKNWRYWRPEASIQKESSEIKGKRRKASRVALADAGMFTPYFPGEHSIVPNYLEALHHQHLRELPWRSTETTTSRLSDLISHWLDGTGINPRRPWQILPIGSEHFYRICLLDHLHCLQSFEKQVIL